METKRSNEYDGVNRTLAKKKCGVCFKDFWVPLHRFERAKVCSTQCRTNNNRKLEKYSCAHCNKENFRNPSKLSKSISKSGLFFCNRECKETAQIIGGIREIMPNHYGTVGLDYRSKAFREFGCICKKCGYKETTRMLDVDHIDSNRQNNNIDNLQVLCVWCHAEKTRANWPT